MIILKFIFLILIAGLVAAVAVVWKFYRRIHAATERLRQQMGGTQDNATRQAGQRTTTTDSGDTIIDTRSQEQANKKIFSKDEGEYVDYTEK